MGFALSIMQWTFPFLKNQIFPLHFPMTYYFQAQIVSVWQYISLFQILLNFTHVTYHPQFGDLNSHTVPTVYNLLGEYLGY